MSPECPACASHTSLLGETTSGVDIYRCDACRLVLVDPMPSPETLTAYYQGFKYSALPDRLFDYQRAYTERGADRILARITALSERPVRSLLDFGGGLGFFAAALSRSIPDVTLFDLDDKALDEAESRFPARFAIARSPEASLDRLYDVILINQVIEHVIDPIAFLAQFSRALAPGGLLIVTTPNNRTNDALYRPDIAYRYSRGLKGGLIKLFSDSWLCCEPPRHLYAFNRTNLGKIASRAGFSEVESTTAYWDEDPFGQPKYPNMGWTSPKRAAQTALGYVAAVTGGVAHQFDRRHEHGTTLISHFRLAA